MWRELSHGGLRVALLGGHRALSSGRASPGQRRPPGRAPRGAGRFRVYSSDAKAVSPRGMPAATAVTVTDVEK